MQYNITYRISCIISSLVVIIIIGSISSIIGNMVSINIISISISISIGIIIIINKYPYY